MTDTCYVYKWTHIPTLRWYVGSKTRKYSHPDDGYICSSRVVKPMILECPDEWERIIIAVGSAAEMRELEDQILEVFDAANDPRSYNQHNNKKDFHRIGATPWNKGLTVGPDVAIQAWATKRSQGKTIPWNKGIPMSDEQKRKISNTKRNR
jgi:hypothetical protein